MLCRVVPCRATGQPKQLKKKLYVQGPQMSWKSAFRAVWRAQRDVFGVDKAARNEAQRRIRLSFRKALTAPASEKQQQEQLTVAFDVAKLLRESVIQAAIDKNSGRFKATIPRNVCD